MTKDLERDRNHLLPVHSFGSHRMTYGDSKSMDQPGKVANPARGQLNREK